MNTIENEYLLISIEKLLERREKKYNFFFYMLVFLQCYRINYIQKHLLLFHPDKIVGLGTFNESKIKIIKNILNALSKNPLLSLNLEYANNQNELIELFYSIYLYFNLNFQKDKIIEMFNDDKILSYLSKKLISFRKLYNNLILPKDIMRKLINKAKTFDEILIYLYYAGNDIVEFLQIIYSEFDFIKNIYAKELDILYEENKGKDKKDQKVMKKIDIEKYIIPKKSDNILKLYEVS